MGSSTHLSFTKLVVEVIRKVNSNRLKEKKGDSVSKAFVFLLRRFLFC